MGRNINRTYMLPALFLPLAFCLSGCTGGPPRSGLPTTGRAATVAIAACESRKKNASQIGKRLFLTLLAISLSSLAVSTAIGIRQMSQAKIDIGEAQSVQAKELAGINADIMAASGRDTAMTLAQSCSESIDGKFAAVTRQVLAVKNCIREAYKYGGEAASRFSDTMCYLQPNVSFEDVEDEFHTVKSACDIIAGVMEADPGVLMYYVSESGFLITGVEVDYSAGSEIDRRTRPWYTGAVDNRSVFWTPVYTDAYTGGLTITCSAPVIDENGGILGVVGYDIPIGPLIDAVLSFNSDTIEYVFLADERGAEFAGSIPEKALVDFLGGGDSGLRLASKIAGQTDGAGSYGDGVAMVGYAPVPTTGWSVGAVIDYQRIVAPARNMGDAIAASRDEFHQYLDGKIRGAILISAAAALTVLLFALLISRRVTRSITKPLSLLTKGVDEIGGGNLDYRIALTSGDEFERLAGAFNSMALRLQGFISNLATVTAERERISAELNVAAKIQANMLPCIFPPYPEREEFDIFGSMCPAKEVGGDFYDFFLVDGDHLCVVIADVSGKGVPAALFMVIAKTLLKNNVQAGKSPKDVFEAVNAQLCENNEEDMFVTAFMGILQISTGRFTYVNAGHNPPLVRYGGGDFGWLPANRGFVLAGMPGTRYRQEETMLSAGSVLYMYTDGVTEAMNRQGALFSEPRLLDCINRYRYTELAELLPSIRCELNAFAAGTEQADDITMLAVRINKAGGGGL